ncbi:MAG TPA: lysophospholipid acyltransferase family protein [Vicinamibacterales bacterium]|nr:lysophospholipid acyltransferase family protein [Vicinamibacterales bacterium]
MTATGVTVWLSGAQRFKAGLIATLGYPIIALLGHTLRWRVEGREHLEAVERTGRPPILAFWHGRILPATWYFRGRGIVVITSENFDGEWIARIIERFGYGTARGSTTRGGQKALLQLRRDVMAGKPAGFTLDGPRGPAKHAQAGAVWLAGATGSPLLPFHIEAARHWTARSWDHTQVPRPFSKMALVIGPAIEVPREPDAPTIEHNRVALQNELFALERRALELLRTA